MNTMRAPRKASVFFFFNGIFCIFCSHSKGFLGFSSGFFKVFFWSMISKGCLNDFSGFNIFFYCKGTGTFFGMVITFCSHFPEC